MLPRTRGWLLWFQEAESLSCASPVPMGERCLREFLPADLLLGLGLPTRGHRADVLPCGNSIGGVGTTDEQVRFLLRDHNEALERWREETTGAERERTDLHNNVMQSKPVQGNSKSYFLKRLKLEAEVDPKARASTRRRARAAARSCSR